jgi:hypothetical protein
MQCKRMSKCPSCPTVDENTNILKAISSNIPEPEEPYVLESEEPHLPPLPIPPGVTHISETLPYSNYEISVRRASRIDPDRITHDDIGFYCPKCKAVLNTLEHGTRVVCKCGLEMELWGNGLQCTMRVID